jgi:hypothetical protein
MLVLLIYPSSPGASLNWPQRSSEGGKPPTVRSREHRDSWYVWPVLTRPNLLLRAEGGIVFVVSILLYGEIGASWILFVVLVLAPDLSILAYLLGVRLGTVLYNIFHVLVAPLVLIALSILCKQFWLLPYGLIWTAHIGVDRLLGFGLKYPTQFRDTHLQRL